MTNYLDHILKEIFYVLNGALGIFVVLELLWSGIVLAYINLNLVLLLWIFVGIVIVIKNKKEETDG